MTRILLISTLILAPFVPALAQDDPGDAPGRQGGPYADVPSRSQLRLVYYRPEHPRADLEVLHEAAQGAFGRKVSFREGKNRISNARNIFKVGASLAILDERGRVEEILRSLPAMEAAAFGEAQSAPEKIETQIVYLKYAEAQAARIGLQAYMRRVPSPSTGSGTVLTHNIVEVPGQNAILVHETAANMRRIRDVLKLLDTEQKAGPSPTRPITLQLWVIQAADKDGESAELPRELVKHLGQLTPYRHFDTLGSGLVRTRPGNVGLSLEMGLGERGECKFAIQRIHLQDDGKEFGLDQITCIARIRREGQPVVDPQNLMTSTTVRTGEYTVLGAAGKKPVFFVLRPVISQ